MAVSSEVRISLFGPRLRLDAEYYKPIYLRRARTLSRLETVELGSIAMVTDGIHASPVFQNGSGIRYISAKCVKDCLFDLSDAEEIAADIHRKNPRTALQVNDVIISTVGTVGFCAVVDADMLPANSDRHVGIVRIYDPKRYDPHYIAAFINSIYGRNQTIREATGNVQLNLFIYAISKLRVPFPEGHQRIGDEVRRALASRRKSQQLYSLCQQMLEDDLPLDRISVSHSVGYETRVSDVLHARRWDANCFNPAFLRYGNAIRKYGNFTRLDQVIFPPAKGLQQDDVDKGDIAYASIKHVRDFEMVTDANASSLLAASKFAEPGDLLLAITGATIGKVGIVARYKRLAFSGDLLRLRVREGLDPHYLLVVLRSPIGQGQLLRWVTGSTNGHLAPRDITRAIIPRLGKREQAISDKVREALSARKEAEDLLEQAKRRIEEIIEQSR